MTLIRNEFIYELDDEAIRQIDLSYWEDFFNRQNITRKANLVSPEASAECNRIRAQCQYMTERLPLLVCKGDAPWGVHIDTGRSCALNINLGPAYESQIALTSFHRIIVDRGWQCNRNNIVDHTSSETEEIFSFRMTRPLIINVSIPHSVRITNTKIKCVRRVVSWGITCPFEDAIKYF